MLARLGRFVWALVATDTRVSRYELKGDTLQSLPLTSTLATPQIQPVWSFLSILRVPKEADVEGALPPDSSLPWSQL